MQVTVRFFSYLKDLAHCAETRQEIPEGSTVGDLLRILLERFPELATAQRSTLIAVGVEYQDRSYRLQPADEVSLFPQVQGG